MSTECENFPLKCVIYAFNKKISPQSPLLIFETNEMGGLCTGLIKMWSQLVAQFVPYSSAHSAYFNVPRKNQSINQCLFLKQ